MVPDCCWLEGSPPEDLCAEIQVKLLAQKRKRQVLVVEW